MNAMWWRRIGAGLLVAALAAALARTARAQESEIEKAASAGKIQVIRPEFRAPEGPPDLLFFNSGEVAEAWDLSIQGDLVKFYSRDRQGSWVQESHSKSTIQSMQFRRTLREYIEEEARRREEPPRVTVADRQPVRKEEILSGRFVARQGEFTRWSFAFTSELHKYYTHAENATEYGRFVLRSHFQKRLDNGKGQENEVIARGKYFLYAPGAVGNDAWVLNLSSVVYIENDMAPTKAYFSDRLPDEVFIVKFSPDQKVFHLKWANQSGWQWTSPVQQTFYRISPLPAGATALLEGARRATGDEETGSLLPPSLREHVLERPAEAKPQVARREDPRAKR